MIEAHHRRGRHRRARGDWWRELLWPGTVTALTVRQALGQGHRERTAPTPPRYPRSPTHLSGATPPPPPAGPPVEHATPDASAPDRPAGHPLLLR